MKAGQKALEKLNLPPIREELSKEDQILSDFGGEEVSFDQG